MGGDGSQVGCRKSAGKFQALACAEGKGFTGRDLFMFSNPTVTIKIITAELLEAGAVRVHWCDGNCISA